MHCCCLVGFLETGTQHVAQAICELEVILSQPSECLGQVCYSMEEKDSITWHHLGSVRSTMLGKTRGLRRQNKMKKGVV